jgi:transcriptional regulator with XRE-family HTH domain
MAGSNESFMTWLDDLTRERGLDAAVDEALHELRLADDLVGLREARGLSQRALAARLGISQPAVAKIESGRAANLQLRTLVRLVTALGGQLTVTIRDRHAGVAVATPEAHAAAHPSRRPRRHVQKRPERRPRTSRSG